MKAEKNRQKAEISAQDLINDGTIVGANDGAFDGYTQLTNVSVQIQKQYQIWNLE